jgi:hypothetical protein
MVRRCYIKASEVDYCLFCFSADFIKTEISAMPVGAGIKSSPMPICAWGLFIVMYYGLVFKELRKGGYVKWRPGSH